MYDLSQNKVHAVLEARVLGSCLNLVPDGGERRGGRDGQSLNLQREGGRHSLCTLLGQLVGMPSKLASKLALKVMDSCLANSNIKPHRSVPIRGSRAAQQHQAR